LVRPAGSEGAMDNRVSSLEKLTSEHGAKLPELKCNIGYIKEHVPDMKQIKDILECMMTKKKKPSTSRYPKVAILLSPWNSSWQIQNQNLPSITASRAYLYTSPNYCPIQLLISPFCPSSYNKPAGFVWATQALV